jgi:hypothetical protein
VLQLHDAPDIVWKQHPHVAVLAETIDEGEQKRDGALPPTFLRWEVTNATKQPLHDDGQGGYSRYMQ